MQTNNTSVLHAMVQNAEESGEVFRLEYGTSGFGFVLLHHPDGIYTIIRQKKRRGEWCANEMHTVRECDRLPARIAKYRELFSR
jgi:hypothetical protein